MTKQNRFRATPLLTVCLAAALCGCDNKPNEAAKPVDPHDTPRPATAPAEPPQPSEPPQPAPPIAAAEPTMTLKVPKLALQRINNRWELVEIDVVDYELVLVPGDAENNIKPFYLGRTEVTWDMFYDWSYATDLDSREYAEAVSKDLRPSPLFEDTPQLRMGRGKRPAIGKSWRTAQAYCVWLSEKTGKAYRLPTDAEWSHALRLAGGVPKDRATLLKLATLADNAIEMDQPPFMIQTNEVASRERDALSLYDLVGNAAEWVQPQGDKRWVRGGHFMLDADRFTADWRAIEDQKVWNETYPDIPVSRHWYIDHYYQGLRLVCEVPETAE